MINFYMVVHSVAIYLLSKEEEDPWTYDSGRRTISPDLPFPFPVLSVLWYLDGGSRLALNS